VQLDLSNYDVSIVNTTTHPRSGLTVSAKVYSLDNKLLLQHEEKRDIDSDAATDGFKLDLAPLFSNGVLLVKLELRDSGGQLASDNLYWLAADNAAYQQLNHLPPASLTASVKYDHEGEWNRLHVHLENKGSAAALETKLTLTNSSGERILPAYYSDNYFSLLPGETREIEIEYPAATVPGTPQLAVRGWNVPAGNLTVATQE
jgi:hypothetical protein